jgi:hypothetical protein
MKLESKDRIYKLTRDRAPLSCIIPSRNSRRAPLLYFDEEKGYNRALRYSRNQKSPFEDEQDGNIIVEPIVFEDGLLRVPKNNPILQQFLAYHPLNGKKFVEVDMSRDAQEEVDFLTAEVDALVEATNLTIDQLETMGRVLFNKDVSLMTTAELKRDVLVFAKRNPSVFLRALSDPSIKLQSTVQQFFDKKLLAYRNKKKDVHFNMDGNKKRMVSIPYGANPVEFLTEWFKTDEGVDVLAFLESQL